MAEEPLLTLRELAVELKLPESTVRYYRDAFLDHIPSVGTGRRRRYPREAVAVLRSIAKSYAGGRSRSEIVSGITGTSAAPAVAPLAEKTTRTLPLEEVSNLDLLAAILDGEREQRDALWQMAKEIVRLTEVLEGQDKVLNEIADHAGVIMSGSSSAHLRSGKPVASLATPPQPPSPASPASSASSASSAPSAPFVASAPPAPAPAPAPSTPVAAPAPPAPPPPPAPVVERHRPSEPRQSQRVPLFPESSTTPAPFGRASSGFESAPPSTFFASPPSASPPPFGGVPTIPIPALDIEDRGTDDRGTEKTGYASLEQIEDSIVGRFTSASGSDMERLRAELESERALVERLREAKLQLEHRAADAEAALEERGGKRGSVIRRLLNQDKDR